MNAVTFSKKFYYQPPAQLNIERAHTPALRAGKNLSLDFHCGDVNFRRARLSMSASARRKKHRDKGNFIRAFIARRERERETNTNEMNSGNAEPIPTRTDISAQHIYIHITAGKRYREGAAMRKRRPRTQK